MDRRKHKGEKHREFNKRPNSVPERSDRKVCRGCHGSVPLRTWQGLLKEAHYSTRQVAYRCDADLCLFLRCPDACQQLPPTMPAVTACMSCPTRLLFPVE